MTSILTQTLARLLLAPVLVVAFAVLVKGYASVGDGFSAGVIAGLGILLQYMAFGRAEAARMLPVRLIAPLAFAGLLAALAVALWPLALGDPIFRHYPEAGEHVIHVGTLELITPVVFDLAIFLLVMGAVVGIIQAIAQVAEEGVE